MSSPRITYNPLPDATPKRELDALAAVYRFILDCRTEKKGTRLGAPDDRKGPEHDPAKVSISQ